MRHIVGNSGTGNRGMARSGLRSKLSPQLYFYFKTKRSFRALQRQYSVASISATHCDLVCKFVITNATPIPPRESLLDSRCLPVNKCYGETISIM